jgi:hypothetical protein
MKRFLVGIILVVIVIILGVCWVVFVEIPEAKNCIVDEDCVVFGETGDCNCGCFNKNYWVWASGGKCFCLAPTSCKCINGKCEGIF